MGAPLKSQIWNIFSLGQTGAPDVHLRSFWMVIGVTWRPCWVTLGLIKNTLGLIEAPWEPIWVTFELIKVTLGLIEVL